MKKTRGLGELGDLPKVIQLENRKLGLEYGSCDSKSSS